ncbi:hypothetical protein [Paenibacillus thailandensis]|uniref:Uncharacterized protein n=1 Tax=Paenibacillus thailandensis TaxID=393250 RepID=A0ABW5QR13_9BACL
MSKRNVVLENVTVKNGVLPSADEVVVKESVIPAGLREVVEEKLEVEVLHVEHPDYDGKIFIAKLTSVWGESKPMFFPLGDLIDKKKKENVIIQLVNRTFFDPDKDFEFLYEYIKCLIRAKLYKTYDEKYQQYLSETEDLSENEDSLEYYKLLVEYIEENSTVFPKRSSGLFEKNWCHGVYLDKPEQVKKFGKNAYAVIPEHLREIFQIPYTNKYGAVLDDLVKKGLLYCGGGKKARKDIVVSLSDRVSMKAYVFTIDPSVLVEEGRRNV